MSTECELILHCDLKAKSDEVAKLVLMEVKRLEKKYNYYDKSSYLSELNTRESDLVDFETKQLLQRAKKYYKLTDKIFDITISTLKPLFSKNLKEEEFIKRRDELLEYVGCEHFSIKKDRLIFDNTFTKLDLGGFVKEYSVDKAVKIIKKHKIKSALINFGGDIYAVGKKSNGKRFVVGIKNPHNTKEYIKYIEIEDEALTTSASYERNYQIEDKVYSHIISKYEDINRPTSASVISTNCVESGVYSTALMIDRDLNISHKSIII
jgi:thiamine biosynthesis lipoprotein